jgi:hypothetical protein
MQGQSESCTRAQSLRPISKRGRGVVTEETGHDRRTVGRLQEWLENVAGVREVVCFECRFDTFCQALACPSCYGHGSVRRRVFQRVDGQDIHRVPGRIEPQSKLLLESREDRQRVCIARRRSAGAEVLPRLFGRPLQLEVETAIEPGAIHHDRFTKDDRNGVN